MTAGVPINEDTFWIRQRLPVSGSWQLVGPKVQATFAPAEEDFHHCVEPAENVARALNDPS